MKKHNANMLNKKNGESKRKQSTICMLNKFKARKMIKGDKPS